jgi:hypothetical protein
VFTAGGHGAACFICIVANTRFRFHPSSSFNEVSMAVIDPCSTVLAANI